MCPCGTQRCWAARAEAKRPCFLLNGQKWITMWTDPMIYSLSGSLQHAEKHGAQGSVREKYTVPWSYHFSLTLWLCQWAHGEVGCIDLFIYPLSFSLFSAVSLLHYWILSLTHTLHIPFPITDVPFHQMKTKAKLWAFSAVWDLFNLQQHDGK